MKNLITLLFVLAASTVFAQVTIKKDTDVKIGSAKAGNLTLSEHHIANPDHKYYTLMYRDQRYDHIIEYESIMFNNQDEINQVYDIFKNALTTKKEIDFELDDQSISVMFSGGSMMVSVYKGGYFTITKGQLDTLFGK